MKLNVNDWLSKEEIKDLVQKSDWKASLEVLKTWGTIGLTFLIAGYFPNIFTILLAVLILGSQQLACAIIMHDGSHRAMFHSNQLNDFVANWLGGYPVFNDAERYRPYHLKHHTNTGTFKDPDISLVKGYPTTVGSFLRKVFRDIAGLTGLKIQAGIFLMNIGYLKYTTAGMFEKLNVKGKNLLYFIKNGFHHYWKPLLANLLMLGILWLCGAAWLYLLWLVALFTSFNFFIRIRSIAEHSMVPDQEDEISNTRTTNASWLEAFLFAPHFVNYHLEHHLLMTVPPYNLPKLHRIIKKKGFFDQGTLAQSYWDVIKMAASKNKEKMQPHVQ